MSDKGECVVVGVGPGNGESYCRRFGAEGYRVAAVARDVEKVRRLVGEADGVVDLPRTRKAMPDKPAEFFLAPDDIAHTVFEVAHQPRSAWTFELEVRPFSEEW